MEILAIVILCIIGLGLLLSPAGPFIILFGVTFWAISVLTPPSGISPDAPSGIICTEQIAFRNGGLYAGDARVPDWDHWCKGIE